MHDGAGGAPPRAARVRTVQRLVSAGILVLRAAWDAIRPSRWTDVERYALQSPRCGIR